MFVRWQLYRSRALNPLLRQRNDKQARLKAVLVESVRVDGEPRHKHIAFLGSIGIDGGDRARFWYEVTTRLNKLSNRLSPEDRERIGMAVAKKVDGGLLTNAEVEQWERHIEQTFG